MIPFNKPYLTGNELKYIQLAVESGGISGNGPYTKTCHEFFKKRYHFQKVLLTSSGTDALEMAAILANIQQGDEVIVPSFTFVSSANAFVLRGAQIIFADSRLDEPNIDASQIEKLITSKTKAIVAVHYAGVACELDELARIASEHNLILIEDAAHAIDSFYGERPLGGIGHLAAFSFHETKNIMCGEGGLLVVNDDSFISRAEIIWEKGTNRAAFWRGEIPKYEWVDLGSSFLPSEISAAFLYAQLETLDIIQSKRKILWECYNTTLDPLQRDGKVSLPYVQPWSTNNAHMFYILCQNRNDRDQLSKYLLKNGIMAVTHYSSLHQSAYYKSKHNHRELRNSDRYSDTLLRLPIYFELETQQVEMICDIVNAFFRSKR